MGEQTDGFTSTNLVRASRLTRTHEAIRDDGVPVLLERVDLSACEFGEQLMYEYERVRALSIDGLVTPLSVERRGSELLVTFPRSHSVDLRSFVGDRPMALETFLPIARRTTEILAALHERHFVHSRVWPGSICVNPEDGEVSLLACGFASALLPDLDDLEWLPYISPEHTRRVGACLDARSDLYSLGATFYRLLTGVAPFSHTRASALLHAHLSEAPASPCEHRPQLPRSLCELLMRLLAKSPHERCASASELLRELELVKRSHDEGIALERPKTSPRVGLATDTPALLELPRELERSIDDTRPRIALLTGLTGLRAAELRAVLEPELLARRTFICHGGFEPERRHVPYLGWTRALEDLFEQLLIGPHEELVAKRAHLQQHLGRLSLLLVELLPRLAQVLGELPAPPPKLELTATRNRIHLAFARLFTALTEGTAVVLILTELHAADHDSLVLLDALLDGGNCGGALLICCTRSHAPSLAALEARLRSTGRKPTRGRLFEVSQPERESVLPTADPSDPELLRHAAYVGAVFELSTLALALGERPLPLLERLARCCSEGVLLRRGPHFEFVDADLRERALADMTPETRSMLDERLALAELDGGANVWLTADRLAGGWQRMHLNGERGLQLVRHCLAVAQRSLDVAAHAAARANAELGLALLEHDPGDEQLHFELAFVRMQALELAGAREPARVVFEQLLAQWTNTAEQARLVAARIELLRLYRDDAEAVELGLAALRRLGCELDEHPGVPSLLLAISRVWLAFRGLSAASLLARPQIDDARVLAIIRIIDRLGPSAYARDPRLLVSLSAMQVMLLLRHGTHCSAAMAVAQLAVALAQVLRRMPDALRLAEYAMALAGDPDRPEYARTEVAAGLVFSLARPLNETSEALEHAYRRNLQIGEFESVSFLASLRTSTAIELGTPLRTIIADCRELDRQLGNWVAPEMKSMVRLHGGYAAALAGDVDAGLGELVIDADGAHVLPLDPSSLGIATPMERSAAAILRAEYFVMMGEYATGLGLLDAHADYERVLMGSWLVLRGALVHAVAAAACHPRAEAREQRRLRRVLDSKLQLLHSWTTLNPDNFGAHHDIALAEHAALVGNHQRALRLLERARLRAREGSYVAALACERMATHTRARGLPILANGALREAWQIYRRWGARAKQRTLEREQTAREATLTEIGARETESSMGLGKLAIDLERVTAALTHIAEELMPERLAVNILTAALEHCGADQGVLLIDLDGVLVVAAHARDGQPVRALTPPRDFTEMIELVPLHLIELLIRSARPVTIDDARTDARCVNDPFIERSGLRSLAGMQLLKRESLLGMLIIENHQRPACFDDERLAVLEFIAAAAAAALDNARLYRALGRSESQWRSLVDGAPDVIALLDQQGRLAFINHALPGWALGQAPALAPASADAWRQALVQALELGRRSEREIAVPDQHGALCWYDAHFAPIDQDDDARRVMVIATEITERKASEALRTAMEGQLRQQQRLESIGTLASGIAHEINNPIQGILNYAELALRARSEPELVSEFAAEIMTEAERVATIVRNLLAFSRREGAPERELLRIHEIVRGTLSLAFSSLRSSQIELLLDVPEDLPPVHCHPQQVQQVLMNLITNARDALNERWPEHHERKRIEVHACVAERGGRSKVRLSVVDHGPGIPPQVLAHIFDPFFTTKGRDRGTGLGLSVSHGIAEDHGGELWVESAVGVGTSFHLDLPIGGDELGFDV